MYESRGRTSTRIGARGCEARYRAPLTKLPSPDASTTDPGSSHGSRRAAKTSSRDTSSAAGCGSTNRTGSVKGTDQDVRAGNSRATCRCRTCGPVGSDTAVIARRGCRRMAPREAGPLPHCRTRHRKVDRVADAQDERTVGKPLPHRSAVDPSRGRTWATHANPEVSTMTNGNLRFDLHSVLWYGFRVVA